LMIDGRSGGSGWVTYGCDLDALGLELLRCWLRGVSRDAADLVFFGQLRVGEDGSDDASSLEACGTEDYDEFGRHVAAMGCLCG